MPKPPISELAQSPPAKKEQSWERTWRFTAWIAGMFSLLISLTLLTDYFRLRLNDPLNSAILKSRKADLRSSSTNESLKASIRQLDWQLRQKYFRHLSRSSAFRDLRIAELSGSLSL